MTSQGHWDLRGLGGKCVCVAPSHCEARNMVARPPAFAPASRPGSGARHGRSKKCSGPPHATVRLYVPHRKFPAPFSLCPARPGQLTAFSAGPAGSAGPAAVELGGPRTVQSDSDMSMWGQCEHMYIYIYMFKYVYCICIR